MDKVRILLLIDQKRIGGMATHSRKLGTLLVNSGHEVFYLSDIHAFLLGSFGAKNVVYVYATRNIKRVIVALLSKLFRFKVVIRIGGMRLFNDSDMLLSFLLRKADHFILVNHVISDHIKEIGKFSHEVLPGFIPTKRNEMKKIYDVSMTFMYTKNDVYNLCSIEMIASTGLTLVIGYYGQCITKIPSYVRNRLGRLAKMHNVTIEMHNSNFENVALKSSIHVRLTKSDGDSNIVREMLFCGIPVICSDLVPRPRGAQVVSAESILSKEDLLNSIRFGVGETDSYDISSHLNFLKHI